MYKSFLFVKQKTAYEMRISDWSSDVCSSDLKEVHSTILNLLREFQSDGYFLEDVEIEPLARLMYNAVNGVFYRWLGDDIMTQAQSFEQMAEHLAILLPPMASKRSHKSVRMPSAAIR